MKESGIDRMIKTLIHYPYSSIEEIDRHYREEHYQSIGISLNNIGTRLPECAKWGHIMDGMKYYTEGRKRLNKPYCEWKIARVEEIHQVAPEPEPGDMIEIAGEQREFEL